MTGWAWFWLITGCIVGWPFIGAVVARGVRVTVDQFEWLNGEWEDDEDDGWLVIICCPLNVVFFIVVLIAAAIHYSKPYFQRIPRTRSPWYLFKKSLSFLSGFDVT